MPCLGCKPIQYAVQTGIGVIATAILDGKVLDSSKVVARQKECSLCPRFNATHNKCMECGCFLKVKWKLAGARCPLKRW